MSEYYEIDKPFSIENWNKLIRDINKHFAAPPVGCPSIEPLEEVNDPHIWSVEDVEKVRDKLKEACPDHTFDEELKVWKTDIIDEIEEKIGQWCGCEPVEFEIANETPRFCGTCCGLHNPYPYTTVRSVIDGMEVGPPGVFGRYWRLYHLLSDGTWSYQIGGPVNCAGQIVYTSGLDVLLTQGCVSMSFCGTGCNEFQQQVVDDYQARHQDLLDRPNFIQKIRVTGGYRPCEEGDA